ncbi:hypothetical protein BZA77DRAFT_302715 [Pyronema omphalodes]|nr:hypothetical protein BZA77DRAFT_302715 [Pyronema omphalodes]
MALPNPHDTRFILGQQHFEVHNSFLAINAVYNQLLANLPQLQVDWEQKYAELERMVAQKYELEDAAQQNELEQQVAAQLEEEIRQSPHARKIIPPPKGLKRKMPPPSAKKTRSVVKKQKGPAKALRKPEKTVRRTLSTAVFVDHSVELRKRYNSDRRKKQTHRFGDMVDWLVVVCTKEERRKRTWPGIEKEKTCLARNLRLGMRQKWRGEISQ